MAATSDLIPNFALASQSGSRITFNSTDGHVAHVFVLEDDVFRVMVLPYGKFNFPRTWAIAPGLEDVPFKGRDRFDLSGFTLPKFEISAAPHEAVVTTARTRLSIGLRGFLCRWDVMRHGRWESAASDRPTQSYNFGWWDGRVYH